jgi:hypothetical protein
MNRKEKIVKAIEDSKYIASCECGESMIGTEMRLHKHILATEVCDFCKSGLEYKDAERTEAKK